MKKIGSALVLMLFMASMALAGGDKIQLKVKGMTCGGCASKVDKAIESMEGVTSSEVSFETTLASVEFDNEKVNVKEIIQSIEKAGFSADIATEDDVKAASSEKPSGTKKACCAGKDKSSCAGKKSHSSCAGKAKSKAKVQSKEEMAQ